MSPDPKPDLRAAKAWKALEKHHAEIGERHLREIFAEDPDRGERLVAEGAGLALDYSKHRVTDETMKLLVDLAKERGVEQRRDAMFAGEHINVSEDRAVLHVALRMPRDRSLLVDGEEGFGVAPLAAHVEQCAHCRAEIDRQLELVSALERLPHLTPSPLFAYRVMSKVQVFEPWHVTALDSVRRFIPRSRPARVLAAASGAFIAVTLTLDCGPQATCWTNLQARRAVSPAWAPCPRPRRRTSRSGSGA